MGTQRRDASGGGSGAAQLRIAFLHPDLGLGGAERLVVDAAAGLARKGHVVTMHTSRYEASRSFAETRDGTFPVSVAGDWLPRELGGRLHILFANLRAVWLALRVGLSAQPVDVFVCDQVSAYVPLLKLLRPRAAVLFYLHFPDQLLAPGRGQLLLRLYRAPFDAFEQLTTGVADGILVNSGFTRGVFGQTFRLYRALGGAAPAILYPCIQTGPGGQAVSPAQASPARVLLSINRYERKKGIDVAIRAFARLLREGKAGPEPLHLVIAGGYDPRVGENVEHYRELVAVAAAEGLVGDAGLQAADDAVLRARLLPGWPAAPAGPARPYASVEMGDRVTFVRSFSDEQKSALLAAASAVVYTPPGEHFGIVPLECMEAGRPVIACASGGPLESVRDGVTGVLCEPTPESFCAAMQRVLAPGAAQGMGEAGRLHVRGSFSRAAFADKLEGVCRACLGQGGAAGAAGAALELAPPSALQRGVFWLLLALFFCAPMLLPVPLLGHLRGWLLPFR